VAPQAGPKIRALGAPLGHCERRPGAAGPPSSGPKRPPSRVAHGGVLLRRGQGTEARRCAVQPRAALPGADRIQQPGAARRSARFSCKALFGPLLGLSGRAARRVARAPQRAAWALRGVV
jgi:hypothetical protein